MLFFYTRLSMISLDYVIAEIDELNRALSKTVCSLVLYFDLTYKLDTRERDS